MLRMGRNENANIATQWRPDGKRKRGRPRETWRKTIEREGAGRGLKSMDEMRRAAKDRVA